MKERSQSGEVNLDMFMLKNNNVSLLLCSVSSQSEVMITNSYVYGGQSQTNMTFVLNKNQFQWFIRKIKGLFIF